MSNKFVDYLNSMNNSGSNTISALAESQVMSPYYEKIKIERNLGKYIAEQIKSGDKTAYIITGHAGDGKTSILVQILSELGVLEEGQSLQEEKEYSYGSSLVYAVKDMSELAENKQIDYFRKAVQFPENNGSSVLISNTGPLLKNFEKLVSSDYQAEGRTFGETEKIELQNVILEQLDKNLMKKIHVGNYDVMVINIARIDNVGFARKVLSKILDKELWNDCESCPKKDFCPINNNVCIVRIHEKRISDFITAYYRFLYENDKRMTIRQILSQISFAFTGNLTYDKIKKNMKNANFKYLFSNLFFGYEGKKIVESALQIKGIAYADDMRLDTISLNNDYKMFVTGNFSDIPSEIRGIAEEQHRLYMRSHLFSRENARTIDDDRQYRKAIRRMYIMFGNSEDNAIYDEIFGKGFNNYVRLISDYATLFAKNAFKQTIVDALYLETTGVSAKNVSEIPLTLKRNDSVYQKVLIISGKVKREELDIEITDSTSKFEDNENKREIYLVICNKKRFRITLPMIIYFERLAGGVISTSANPALTHGISTLKTLLRECTINRNNDSVIKIMLNKTGEAKYYNLEIEDKKLYFS